LCPSEFARGEPCPERLHLERVPPFEPQTSSNTSTRWLPTLSFSPHRTERPSEDVRLPSMENHSDNSGSDDTTISVSNAWARSCCSASARLASAAKALALAGAISSAPRGAGSTPTSRDQCDLRSARSRCGDRLYPHCSFLARPPRDANITAPPRPGDRFVLLSSHSLGPIRFEIGSGDYLC
jgi:hypothetical protein